MNKEGVENNVFIPNEIHYVFGEKKKHNQNMYLEFFQDYKNMHNQKNDLDHPGIDL